MRVIFEANFGRTMSFYSNFDECEQVANARVGSAYRNVARVGRRVIDTHGYKCVYKFVFISVYSSILNQKPIMDAFWVICDLQNSAW